MDSPAKFCCICINNNVNLRLLQGKESETLHKLNFCVPEITFPNEITQNVCVKCYKKLETVYEFKQMCIRNQSVIQTVFYIKDELALLEHAAKYEIKYEQFDDNYEYNNTYTCSNNEVSVPIDIVQTVLEDESIVCVKKEILDTHIENVWENNVHSLHSQSEQANVSTENEITIKPEPNLDIEAVWLENKNYENENVSSMPGNTLENTFVFPIASCSTPENRKMKEIFEEQFKYFKNSNERSDYFPSERYNQIIYEVQEAKLMKQNKNPLTSKQYRRLKRYDVITVDGNYKLITNTNGKKSNNKKASNKNPSNKIKNSTMRYFAKMEDIFDIIDKVHIMLGHKRTRVMEAELKKTYVNVTRTAIELYLALCEHCQQKKYKKKKVISQTNSKFQEVDTSMEVGNNFASAYGT